MPKLKLDCPKCGARLQGVTTDMVGDIGVCPKCRVEFEIKDEVNAKRRDRGIRRALTATARGIGLRVLIVTPPFDVVWPDTCVMCNRTLGSEQYDEYTITLPEKWAKEPTKLRSCPRCSMRLGNWRLVGGVGYLLSGIGFVLFLVALYGHAEAVLKWWGGSLFWVGVLLSWLGCPKDRIGVTWGALVAGGLQVSFRHRPFGEAFFDLNRNRLSCARPPSSDEVPDGSGPA